MIEAQAFVDRLRKANYTHYSGVPCSFLKPFINYVINSDDLDYVTAASEGEAVGISLGAHLAGRKTVTMCQNSGLGNMVNPLTSLNYPFRIPGILIVTWRGEPGIPDEPQHVQMGTITHRMLETMDIPWREFPSEESEIDAAIAEAEVSIEERQRPFAFIMRKGSVAPHDLNAQASPELLSVDPEIFPSGEKGTRTEAIEAVLGGLHGGEVVVATTGKTGRELFTVADNPNHLYVVGGMGTASAIGLGINHANPNQKAVVLDGDGAALMKMGVFATIGRYQPKGLIHIVLDNEQHDSTGGQATASSITDFAKIAAASSYRHVYSVERPEDLQTAVGSLNGNQAGPALIHVKIKSGSPSDLGRPTVKPHEVKERFMNFISQTQN
ncbi:MAG: phosphonopyruvate decarboxylase [Verrucomicrobiales bacterium]|nr:phosphonopyruvate decarboxylase [Verrucomicrobiales bacterium]